MAGDRARQVAIALAIAAAAADIGAQEPQHSPTFRSEIHYVQIPVRVLDAHGEFVRGLTQSDFKILEDGQPQAVAAFSTVEIPFVPRDPVTPGAPPVDVAAQPVDVAMESNDLVHPDGRVYLFVLDNQNMDAATAIRTRHVMRRFIRDGVGANDVAAIVFTGAGRGQSFTQDGRLLDAALDRFMSDADPTDNQSHRTTTLISESARSLGSVRDRRKAIILVTSSTICSLGVSHCRADIDYALRASIQSEVSVYTIDAAGLHAYERTRAEHANPNSMYGDGGRVEARSGAAARAAFGAARSEFHGPLSGARYLAEASGGFAIVNSNSLDEGFQRVVRENSAYYLLGYYSTNTRTDGKLRRNQVTVSRTGLRVVHRSGYLAPRGKP